MTVPSALTASRAFCQAAQFALARDDDGEAERLQAWADALLLWRAWPIVAEVVGRSDPKLGAVLTGLAPRVGKPSGKDLVVDLADVGAGTRRMLSQSRQDAVAAALRTAAGWDVKLRVT